MRFLLLAVFFTFTCSYLYAGETIYIGRSSNELAKENKRITPIADYLNSKLKHAGIDDVKINLDLRNSVDTLLELIDENRMHLILESPYAVSQYYEEGKADPLLIISRSDKITQHTVFFSRNDSGISNLKDMAGKTLAFEDRNSTTGFVLPMKYMQQSGLELRELKEGDKPSKDKINYLFAESEINITTWVNIKKVDVGVLNIYDWNNKKYNPDNFKDQTTVIDKTPEIITMFISAANTLSPDKKDKIKRVLLDMHKSREGRDALKNFKIDFFLELPENWKEYNKIFMQ